MVSVGAGSDNSAFNAALRELVTNVLEAVDIVSRNCQVVAVVRSARLMHDHQRWFDWLRGQMRLGRQVNRLWRCIISGWLRRRPRGPFSRAVDDVSRDWPPDRRSSVSRPAPDVHCIAVNSLLRPSLHHKHKRLTVHTDIFAPPHKNVWLARYYFAADMLYKFVFYLSTNLFWCYAHRAWIRLTVNGLRNSK